MGEISKITVAGAEYGIKDETARALAKEAAEGAGGGLTEVGSVSYTATVDSGFVFLDGKRLEQGVADWSELAELNVFARNEKVKFCKVGLTSVMGTSETPILPIATSAVDTSRLIIGTPDFIVGAGGAYGRDSFNFSVGSTMHANLARAIEQESIWGGNITLTFTFYA